MALKGRPGPIQPLVANAAVAQYRFVKHLTGAGAADGLVVHSAAAGDKTIGVTTRPAAAKGAVDVAVYGAFPVEYGGAVTRGDALKAGADGKALASAAANDRICGVALASGVDGDIGLAVIAPSVR